jgi:hypothetical protein
MAVGKKYEPDGIEKWGCRVVEKTRGAEAEIGEESIIVILILMLGWGIGGIVPPLHYSPAVLTCTKILNEKNTKPESESMTSTLPRLHLCERKHLQSAMPFLHLPPSLPSFLWPHPHQYQNHDQKHEKVRGQRG